MTYPNDPAFSTDSCDLACGDYSQYGRRSVGLSKREYFAATICGQLFGHWGDASHYLADGTVGIRAVIEAVTLADALITELNKEKK